MPIAKIPFLPKQESGFEELAGASPIAMNVIVDGKGAVRRRPVLAASSSLYTETIGDGDPITGLHVGMDGKIYAYASGTPGDQVYLVSAGGAAQIASGIVADRRPTFASTSALTVIANGGPMLKFDLATLAFSELGGDPPRATHVVANSQRLVSNNLDEDGRVNYSALAAGSSYAGHEVWEGDLLGSGSAGYFQAEARPDDVAAVQENTSEVFIFGTTTMQVYAPDSAYVYAPASTRERGCLAPYSVVKVDQAFAWLDHERRFVFSDGRTVKVVSDPIQRDLDGIEDPTDCFGYRVAAGPVEVVVWTFPSDGRSFAYTVGGGGWAQWSSWDSDCGNWAPMMVTASTVSPFGGMTIAGTSTGKVGEFSISGSQDLGTDVVAYVQTGYLDRDTPRKKHCKFLRMAFKRGQGSVPNEKVLVSWRDDQGPFVGFLELDMGDTGDTDPEVEVSSLGVYRRRQWKFTFSGSSDLVLASATEEFEILEE